MENTLPIIDTNRLFSAFDDFDNLTNNFFNLNGINNKDKYPKYQILSNKKDKTIKRIKVAVAGLDKDKLHLMTKGNKIVIRYDDTVSSADDGWEVNSNSISTRSFSQQFFVSDGCVVEIKSAKVINGILIVDVKIGIPVEQNFIEHAIQYQEA